MTIDTYQGRDENGNKFGYVHGEDGGFFFTWLPTLDATIGSIQEDELDGDGGLTESEVAALLREKIGHRFADAADDVEAEDAASHAD